METEPRFHCVISVLYSTDYQKKGYTQRYSDSRDIKSSDHVIIKISGLNQHFCFLFLYLFLIINNSKLFENNHLFVAYFEVFQ